MTYPGKLVPTKEEQSDEGGFQKECHEAFDRQWGTKNIANVMTVIGPVHPKLKLHHNAGGHTHCKIDSK